MAQCKWVEQKSGSRFAVIRWEQTAQDDEAGWYLKDGWYRAKQDLRTYWAIPLEKTEYVNILEGRFTVRVRPWIVNMVYHDKSTKNASSINLPVVFENIAAIWRQADVGIEIEQPMSVTVTLSKALKSYKDDNEFTDEVNNQLREKINNVVGEEKVRARECIHAVFIPSYDRWGFTHHEGDKGYVGPVVFVATHTAGVGTLNDCDQRETPPSEDLQNAHMGISLDAAHEIGHALGLEHDAGFDNVQSLMHQALYHVIWGRQQKTAEEALTIARERFKNYKNIILFVTKSPTSGNERWVVLHGAELTSKQIQTVHKNATFLRIAV